MTPVLSVHDLSLRIGNKTIGDHYTFEVMPGDCWGILGSNGSGKTTLLHTLAGLHTPLAGEILLQGKKLQTVSARERACQLGILFQQTDFSFSQSALTYCALSRYAHSGDTSAQTDLDYARTALQQMALGQYADRDVRNLSGGEKKRLALAALLTQQPQLYLLDEPVNHLDIQYRFHVLDYFEKLAREKQTAVMMSGHDVNLIARYCNKVLMMFDDGNVLIGATAELFTVEILSRLYRYPVTLIEKTGMKHWVFLKALNDWGPVRDS